MIRRRLRTGRDARASPVQLGEKAHQPRPGADVARSERCALRPLRHFGPYLGLATFAVGREGEICLQPVYRVASGVPRKYFRIPGTRGEPVDGVVAIQ